MSSVIIPWTRVQRVAIRPRLFSGEQEGTLGGPDLAVPRPGDRFAVDVTTTQFRQDDESRLFMSALFRATTQDGIIALRQPNLTRKLLVGTPVIDGANQAGSSLAVRGALGAVLSGQFLSIIHSGRRYVHMVSAPAEAASNGKIVIPIWPMLRFLTVDGEMLELGAPMIEGKLTGFDKGVAFNSNRTEPFTFTIAERA